MSSPSVYTNIVTPRSRRLRTIGLVLLPAVGVMALYGYFGLMPNLDRNLRENAIAGRLRNVSAAEANRDPTQLLTKRAQRVRKVQIATALAYWGVCSLCLVGVVFVAWLDFREVTRRYVDARRAIWTQAGGASENSDEDG